MKRSFYVFLLALMKINPAAGSGLNDTMVVTATANGLTDIFDAPASISVIDVADESRYKFISDVGDLLRSTPGVNVSTQSNGSRSISIRGLSNDYTSVLLNGRRTSSREALWRGSDNALALTPSIAIEKIEVIRGPMSTLYGSDTMGGVINIITKKNKGIQEGSLNFEGQNNFGDHGGRGENLEFYYSTPLINKIDYTTFGNYLKTDESFYNYSKRSTKERKQNNYNVQNELDLKFNDKGILSFTMQHSNEKQKGSSLYGGRFFEQDRVFNDYNLAYIHDDDINRHMINANYNKFRVKYNTSSSNISEENYSIDTTNTLGFDGYHISFGAGARKVNVENGSFSRNSVSRESSSFFIESGYNISPLTTSTVGVRYDHDSLFGGEYTYRGYITHKLTNSVSVKSGGGTSFRSPSMAQISSSYSGIGCAGRCRINGNSNLNPETGRSVEIGIYYNRNSTHFSSTAFYNKISELIQMNRLPNKNFSFINVDSASIKGIETSVEYRWDDFLFNLSHTYLDGKNNASGNRLFGTAINDISSKWVWFLNQDIDVYSTGHYRGKSNGLLGGNDTAGSYIVIDVGITSYINEGFRLKTGVNNITNKDISSPYTYSEIIQGRTLFAGVVYDF